MAEKQFDNVKVTVEFEETANRQQVATGDSLSILFSKVKKFFADLKTVAFSGSYNDLDDKPEIPTYSNMTAATASAAGKAGLVPAPAAGKQNSFLRGDGTWAEVTATNAEKISIQKLDAPSTGTAYYPAFVDSNNTTATSETLYTNNGVKWTLKGGTTTVEGYALMSLGNSTLAGSNGNMKGQLQFFNNTNEYYAVIQQSTSQTGNISVNMPTVSGTLALLSSTVSKANYQSSTAGTSPNASYLRQIASGTTEATTTNCPAGCLYGQYS